MPPTSRLKMLHSAPMGSIMTTVVNLLVPLMPGTLGSKLHLMQEKTAMYATLAEVRMDGSEGRIQNLHQPNCLYKRFAPRRSWRRASKIFPHSSVATVITIASTLRKA